MNTDYDKLREEAQAKIAADIYRNGWPEGCALIKRQQAAIDELRGLCDRLKMEAQIHAQEAATQRSTVQECYRAVTEGKGEPGDWNGARPVIAELERLRNAAALDEAMQMAARDLPESWSISFEVEKGYGGIVLNDPNGNRISADDYGSVDSSLAKNVAEAVAYAKENNS